MPTQNQDSRLPLARSQFDVASFVRTYINEFSDRDRKAALDVVNGRRANCYVTLGTEIFYLTRVVDHVN